MSKWVLKEITASRRLGKPIYYRAMTAIGPMTTDDARAAAAYDDELTARMNRPWFSLAFFEPVQLDEEAS